MHSERRPTRTQCSKLLTCTDCGFEFIAQGGVAYAAVKAESSSSGAMAQDKQVYPLVNLNIGWSF